MQLPGKGVVSKLHLLLINFSSVHSSSYPSPIPVSKQAAVDLYSWSSLWVPYWAKSTLTISYWESVLCLLLLITELQAHPLLVKSIEGFKTLCLLPFHIYVCMYVLFGTRLKTRMLFKNNYVYRRN